MSLHVVAFPARANPTDLSIFRKNVPFEKRREVGGRANAPRSKNWSIDERRGERGRGDSIIQRYRFARPFDGRITDFVRVIEQRAT